MTLSKSLVLLLVGLGLAACQPMGPGAQDPFLEQIEEDGADGNADLTDDMNED